MSLTGTWNMRISTPIGAQSAVLELSENDGVVVGVAKNDAETLPLINPILHGTRLTWQLSAPPKNWKELVNRAERFHIVGVWAAVLAFAFFLTAVALKLAVH